MNQFIKSYNLKITPLTPVHIGTDEYYQPGNYVIDTEENALYSFDSGMAMQALTATERKQLLNIVNDYPSDAMLKKVQGFFHNARNSLMAFSLPPLPVTKGVNNLYNSRIGAIAQHEGGGKKVINKLEIDRTFYNPIDYKPVLPGSSIKGAIRTALLDSLNNGKPFKSFTGIRTQLNNELQKSIFGGSFATDPMRLISLADASWQAELQQPVCQIKFAVNRKRHPVMHNGKLVEPRGIPKLLECITPHFYQSFTGSITLQDIKQINSTKGTPTKQFTIQEIASACNNFYGDILHRELKELQDRALIDINWKNHLDSHLNGDLKTKLDSGQAFLLRVGRHSGADSVTLNGVRSIKILKAKGESPSYESKPKTWWLAADNVNDKQSLLPFGWILVEINPQLPNQQLKDWLETSGKNLAIWMQNQSQKQADAKKNVQIRLELENKKRLAEQAEAEAANLAAIAEAERMANLSPLQLEFEQLLAKFPVAEHDTKLLQELEKGHWQGADAVNVALKVKDLMIQAGKWIPDFNGTNDKKLKLKQRCIKVLDFIDTKL